LNIQIYSQEGNEIVPGNIQKIRGKSSDTSDEVGQLFEKVKIEVLTVRGFTVYWETLELGWQWSKHARPIVGDDGCQRFHVKIFLARRQQVRMDDRTEMEFGPADVAAIHSGHDAWVVERVDRAGGRRKATRMSLVRRPRRKGDKTWLRILKLLSARS